MHMYDRDLEYLQDRTLLCETCNGGCDVRGWCQYREEHGRWAVGGQLGLG